MTEQVWVLPESYVSSISGFVDDDDKISEFWNSLPSAVFMDRSLAEHDPGFKQIIPYVLISSGGKFLAYEREGGNEARLARRVSLGIGGHVNSEDFQSEQMRILYFAVLRELDEELCVVEGGGYFPASSLVHDKLFLKGLLYDDSDAVGRVHLGVVLHAEIGEDAAARIKILSEGKDLKWLTPEEIVGLGDRVESWSRKSLEALVRGTRSNLGSLKDLSDR